MWVEALCCIIRISVLFVFNRTVNPLRSLPLRASILKVMIGSLLCGCCKLLIFLFCFELSKTNLLIQIDLPPRLYHLS